MPCCVQQQHDWPLNHWQEINNSLTTFLQNVATKFSYHATEWRHWLSQNFIKIHAHVQLPTILNFFQNIIQIAYVGYCFRYHWLYIISQIKYGQGVERYQFTLYLKPVSDGPSYNSISRSRVNPSCFLLKWIRQKD